MKGKNWAWIAGAVMMTGVLFLFSCQSSQFNRGKYAIIMKSRNNWYNELASEGFKQTVEDAGKNCIVLYPDHPSAQEQIHLIQNLIDEKVEAIAVAANDEYALTPVLTQAREKGISVITLDADVEAGSRSIYISPVDARELGKELVREVDRICGHSGQWGILSAGSRSANQNEWIYMMKQELQNLEYRDLRLVDIAYGEGEYEKAAEKANLMLETYPDLKVMCCLSTEGIKAAADVVKARGQASKVKVIGLGLPTRWRTMWAVILRMSVRCCTYGIPWTWEGWQGMCAWSCLRAVLRRGGTRSCFWEAGPTPWITVMTAGWRS